MENRTKALALFLLLLAPAVALADPASIAANVVLALGASYGTAAVVATFVATYGATIAGLSLALYSTAAAKRKARAAAARQRAEYNAGLSDRMATMVSADAPQRVVYGRSYVGGTIVAMFTSDRPKLPSGGPWNLGGYSEGPGIFSKKFEMEGKTEDALRHLVVVLTAHECEAIGNIKIDGFELGELDANGYPTAGEYAKNKVLYQNKAYTVPANGQLVLPEPGVEIVSVVRMFDNDRGRSTSSAVPYTVAGSVVSVHPSLVGATVRVTVKFNFSLAPVRVQKHRGYPGEPADAYLMSAVPTQWTANHRLAGYSYLVVTLDLNDRRFQGGPPGIQAEVQGKKVFDPRTGLTAWSDNPALCTADFLQSPMWAGSSRISVVQSDLIAAANVCDELIPNRTGVTRAPEDFSSVWKIVGYGLSVALGNDTMVKRYTCNGSFSADEDPEGVLEDLRESMAGDAFVAGGWRILAGSWTAPVATLDIAEADGQVEVVQVGASWASLANSVRGNYVPIAEAAAKDFTSYINGTLESADGQRLWADVSYAFTNQEYRCQNLSRIRVEKSRNGMTLRWPAPAEAWGLQPGDRVWVKYPIILGEQLKTFRITEWSYSLQTPVMLTLEEDAPEVWDLSDQTLVDQTPNSTLPNPFYIPEVSGLSASSGAVQDLLRLSDGTVVPTVRLTWDAAGGVPAGTSMLIQYRAASASDSDPVFTVRVPAEQREVVLQGVQEQTVILIRARYESSLAESEWRDLAHEVIGKTAPPTNVLSGATTLSEGYLNLSWGEVPDRDVTHYEVRLSDTGWGGAGAVFKGSALSCPVEPAAAGTSRTWYVRALDSSGNYSLASLPLTYTLPAVANPASGAYQYADTSLTSAEVLLSWAPVNPPLGLKDYVLTYGAETMRVATNHITLPANWLGQRTYTIRAVDRASNQSSGLQIIAEKLPPAQATGLKAQVIDNVVMLYWKMPVRTSLPISHVKIRRGAAWETAVDIGTKDGEFTTITELAGGVYTYWVAVVDTDDNESTPTSVTATVSQPPDFRFNGDFPVDFNATRVNSVKEGSGLLMLVNTTETFAQHFTNNAWASPADQIAAGYPRYIQPGTATASYEQIFDYDSSLGSSNVSVELDGVKLAGNPTVVVTLSFSNGGGYTDYPGALSVFATAFRYVKIRVDVTRTAVGDLYQINTLRVVLQSKQKTDSGNTAVGDATAAPSGTVVNFNAEFVDIESITPVGMGTVAVTAVPEFKDTLLNGTYSVTSNVATVTATAHELIVGQNVRLDFSSGLGIRGVYTVTSVPNANSFTVAMGASNTSGSVTAYWAGFRVRLFNSSGTRVGGSVSWTARGY